MPFVKMNVYFCCLLMVSSMPYRREPLGRDLPAMQTNPFFSRATSYTTRKIRAAEFNLPRFNLAGLLKTC